MTEAKALNSKDENEHCFAALTNGQIVTSAGLLM